MSLAQGRSFLSIPGPTTVPDRVLQAMHRPAIDIYSGPLVATTESCLRDIAWLAGSSGQTYLYIANGHGAWEAALSNTLCRGDRVLVLESGRFATGWGLMGEALGLDIAVLERDWRRAIDPDAVREALSDDREGRIRAVLAVQIDTASGAMNDIPAIRQAIDDAGHDALFMVDTIASLASVPFSMDEWRIDLAVGACQKGLMTPPGLAFVLAGERARAAHARADLRTRYWDWTERDGPEHYQTYCGTPPEHLLFGLREALDMIREEGLDHIHQRHTALARMVRAAVDVWSGPDGLDFNISEPSERADSVTTILMPEGWNPEILRQHCEQEYNVILGSGIGKLTGKAFRIAHMGHCNAPTILGVLGSVEAGLAAVGIPHGRGGVEAAIATLGASRTGNTEQSRAPHAA